MLLKVITKLGYIKKFAQDIPKSSHVSMHIRWLNVPNADHFILKVTHKLGWKIESPNLEYKFLSSNFLKFFEFCREFFLVISIDTHFYCTRCAPRILLYVDLISKTMNES